MDKETIHKSVTNLMKKTMNRSNAIVVFPNFAETLPDDEKIYYDNQEKMGKDITQAVLTDGIFFQIVVALTQSGKTGCMNALIKECIESVDNKILQKICLL